MRLRNLLIDFRILKKSGQNSTSCNQPILMDDGNWKPLSLEASRSTAELIEFKAVNSVGDSYLYLVDALLRYITNYIFSSQHLGGFRLISMDE